MESVMTKFTTFLMAAGAIIAISVNPTLAGSPDSPGEFGKDRAEWLKAAQDDDTAPGASEWGHIAGERGSDNGQINRDYRDASGGSPNPDNDRGRGNNR